MIGQPSGGGLMGQRAGQGQQQQQGFNQGGMMGQQTQPGNKGGMMGQQGQTMMNQQQQQTGLLGQQQQVFNRLQYIQYVMCILLVCYVMYFVCIHKLYVPIAAARKGRYSTAAASTRDGTAAAAAARSKHAAGTVSYWPAVTAGNDRSTRARNHESTAARADDATAAAAAAAGWRGNGQDRTEQHGGSARGHSATVRVWTGRNDSTAATSEGIILHIVYLQFMVCPLKQEKAKKFLMALINSTPEQREVLFQRMGVGSLEVRQQWLTKASHYKQQLMQTRMQMMGGR